MRRKPISEMPDYYIEILKLIVQRKDGISSAELSGKLNLDYKDTDFALQDLKKEKLICDELRYQNGSYVQYLPEECAKRELAKLNRHLKQSINLLV